MSQTPALSTRRNDLDWIRVAAFGLLILYHVALVYAPYDWHVHSAHTFGWLHEAVLITNPWRLTLLFLVSGAALRLMAARRTPGRTLRDRAERLIPPLIFGTLVLVPIQSWIEAIDKGGFDGTFIDWLVHEFGPTGLSNGVPVNHLWFIVYIAVYSLVAVALMTRPVLMARLEDWLARATAGWRVLVVPIAYLIVIRIVLFPLFGITNRLSWDGYNHFLSLGAFLFGFLMVRHEELWAGLERHRRTAAIIALIALPIMMAQAAHPGGATWFGIPRAIIFGIDQWAVIAAILGYGSRYLRQASGPALRYLVDATFTLYLAHQTVLVVAVWFIRPANLPAPLEAAALVGITFGVSLLIYEIVKRIPLIRPLWGLKPLPDTVVRPRYARRRRLLIVGVAAPLLALVAVLIGVATYPGFDHARQYLSELGGASAPMPLIFNGGVFIAGLMCMAAGVGFGLAIHGLTERWIVASLTAVVFILAGIGLAVSSLYPWPDPRHMAINLGLGIQIAPLLLLWGLWSHVDLRRLKVFLFVTFVAMAILTVFTHHMILPGTVNPANVGWWERAYAIILVGWVGIAAFALERRLKTHADRHSPDDLAP
ncbi:acyltransferase family protein [Brevundimonas sp.]|uniref:acyltransferase family protein n=1 Tax=Brevundimonas sp. TaxID=1871086 RepID=UPI0025C577ED|nr:acyltransferase family protein [Brevundimonas sp.]